MAAGDPLLLSPKSTSTSAVCRSSPISTSTCTKKRSSVSSAPTAPARPRCSISSLPSTRSDRGSIRFKDKEITGLAPHKICHLGIARTYQLVRAFLKMSVFENVMTAAVYGRQAPRPERQAAGPGGHRTRRAVRQARHQGGPPDPLRPAPAGDSHGSGLDAGLILLDEPMAGLTDVEIENLLGSSRPRGTSASSPSCGSSTRWTPSWTSASAWPCSTTGSRSRMGVRTTCPATRK